MPLKKIPLKTHRVDFGKNFLRKIPLFVPPKLKKRTAEAMHFLLKYSEFYNVWLKILLEVVLQQALQSLAVTMYNHDTTIGDATLWHRKQALRWGDATISATLDLEERKKGG